MFWSRTESQLQSKVINIRFYTHFANARHKVFCQWIIILFTIEVLWKFHIELFKILSALLASLNIYFLVCTVLGIHNFSSKSMWGGGQLGWAGYIKDAVYCRIGVYWSWIIHFRYFEKTTNIWPIFHFFSLLHILSSVKFKVEDRVNFCGHLRIWNIRSKLCHHFKFTDPGFTGLHWAILHAQKEACAEIPVCLVSGLQNNRTDYPVSHISNPIHSPIVFIFKSSSSYQRRWLARDWWKATTQRVGTVYHGR